MKNRNLLTAVIAVLIIIATAAIALAEDPSSITFTSVLVNGKDASASEGVTLKPLQTLEVTFKVKNILNEKVTKITNGIIDENGDVDNYKFTVDGTTQFHLEAGQESAVQKITTTIPADVPNGKYFLTLTSQGYTLDDKPVSVKKEFNFTVTHEKAEIVVKVDPVAKNTLTCSATTTLNAMITNTGTVKEDDIVTKVMDGSTEVYNSQKAGVNLTLAAGQSKSIAMPVTITTEGQHTLSVETGFNYINNVPASTANTVTISIAKQACLSSTITPTNTDLKVLDGTTLNFGVSTNEENYGSSVVWTVDGTQKGTGKTFSQTFSTAGTFTVKATLNQESKTWKVVVADKPLDLTSFGWTQSQVDAISDPSNVKDVVLNTAEGSITFTQPVDLSDMLTVSDVIKITSQSVAVDSVKAPSLNKPATIMLKNVDGKGIIKVYKYDGFTDASVVDKAVSCPETVCTIGNQQNSGFTFSVTGFSTFIAVSQKAAELTLPSEIVIEDGKTTSNLSTIFTVQNTGTTESVKNIVFELSNFASSANAKLLNAPTQLAPQESKTLTLQVDSDKNANSGKKLIGTIKVSSDKGSKSVPVYTNSKSFLVIESVKINGKTSGTLSLVDAENVVEVTVRNDYTDQMDDVAVTVKILDVDGTDLEEESEEFKLSESDDNKVKLTFDLHEENVDKKQYTLEIIANGKADDGTTHETTTTQIVDVEIKSHDIIIKRASLLSGTALCGQQYETLDVTIKNIGSNDEDNVEIRVKNSALNLELFKKNIELDKFSGSDSEFETTFTVDLQKATAGNYPLTIEVYRNGVLQTSSTVTLSVQNCGSTGATVLGTNGAAGQDTLAKQLQEQLNAKVAGNQPVVKTSLRDSNSYVLLLGGMVVLIFVALVLAMALIWKKK
ncbi:hypothetical protein HYT55_01685 [Candidatus Woesearchaeota archaeon]|nr:hypothetical protein [Candidatus Woesearchaeota archaeon]